MAAKTETKEKSVFATLNAIDVNEHVEKKNGLTYLSWSWAWQYVKELYPTATYTIYESDNGRPYFTDGRTCWVKTGVTIEGLEHIEYLPIMDYRNQSITVDRVTSTDMNKSIQRSLTKAIARHGLGLYIYAGEDLPASADNAPAPQPAQAAATTVTAPLQQTQRPQEQNIFDQMAAEQLEEAFQLVKPEIEGASSRSLLQSLHEMNPQLHNYQPYKDAMNKRYKEVA